MTRTVNRLLIDRWIDEHKPEGLFELARASRLSATTIGHARRGIVPVREITRVKLCETLGVSEDELFPPVAAGEENAS